MGKQLIITPKIQSIADSVSGNGVELLLSLRDKVFELISARPLTEETKVHEQKIRWQRTADQIFNDGFVYEGKSCTDLVIAFLGLSKAKGLETRFVKIKDECSVHSVTEIKIDDKWFIFDVALPDNYPIENTFEYGKNVSGWNLWKKGSDSWDIGLCKYKDIKKID